MKILIVSHKFFPDIGGIESVTEILATQFVEKGHEVSVLTWSTFKSDNQFKFNVIRKPGLITQFRALRKADVVLENNPSLQLSWVNILVRKPIVVALHTWLGSATVKERLLRRLKNKWLYLATEVIACSEVIRKEIYPAAVTIQNPYNDQLFRKLPEVARSKDFIFLGRLISDKGVAMAIEAFILFSKKYNLAGKGSTLTIVGNGEEKAALEQKVADMGFADKIVFTGSKKGEELVKILNAHRYILIPSLWKEPFGLVALEGLACGCIPLVSNYGGLPEAIGKAGVCFERGSVASLAEKMNEIKSDAFLQQKLLSFADAHLEEHKMVRVSSMYLDVLKKVE